MTNEEIKKEVLHRVAVQKKKRQRILRVSASLGAVVLVSLAGVGLMGGDVFKQTPPITDTVVKNTTTVTTAPTKGEDTTTTATTETTTVTTVTTTTPTQAITTRSQTQASIKGPHNRPTSSVTNTPLSNRTIILNDGAVYRPITDADRTTYGLPQEIDTEDVGEPLGRVGAHTEAPIYSADPALVGGTVYTYGPIADKKVLIVLCGAKCYVFILT